MSNQNSVVPRWPEQVQILGRVGFGSYERCALGLGCREIGINPVDEDGNEITAQFRRAYERVSEAFLGGRFRIHTVEYINDVALRTSSDRALVYNATWAYLGYTVGQSKEVKSLVRKARKLEACEC